MLLGDWNTILMKILCWLLATLFFSNIYMHLQGYREYSIFWHCKANKINFFKKMLHWNFYSTIEWNHLHKSLLLNAVDEEMACKNYEDDFFLLSSNFLNAKCLLSGRTCACMYLKLILSFYFSFLYQPCFLFFENSNYLYFQLNFFLPTSKIFWNRCYSIPAILCSPV